LEVQPLPSELPLPTPTHETETHVDQPTVKTEDEKEQKLNPNAITTQHLEPEAEKPKQEVTPNHVSIKTEPESPVKMKKQSIHEDKKSKEDVDKKTKLVDKDNMKKNTKKMVDKTSDLQKSKRKERLSVDTKPVTETVAALDEILSDVSSVHTSDLSDFDDRISISSGDEAESDANKRKISLQEVKKMADKKKRKTPVSDFHAEMTETPSTSRRGRERKVNPKYSSDEYYTRSTKSSLINDMEEEDIESEEDFDQQDSGKEIRLESPEEPVVADNSPEPPVKIEEVSMESPVDSAGKQSKKRPQRRSETQTQRYDASDLYKPRPVIGSSRRNRTQTDNL